MQTHWQKNSTAYCLLFLIATAYACYYHQTTAVERWYRQIQAGMTEKEVDMSLGIKHLRRYDLKFTSSDGHEQIHEAMAWKLEKWGEHHFVLVVFDSNGKAVWKRLLTAWEKLGASMYGEVDTDNFGGPLSVKAYVLD